jgi:alkylation response protein AidB-like acyl-CoA dehydrogenase
MTPSQELRAGELLAESQSLTLMGHRATLRALRGLDPGAGASVGKLLGAEHEQRVQEFGLSLAGTAGSFRSGEAESWILGSLVTRCLTIAGGTSEVQRNLIAERLLGQPRDPEPPPSLSPH